MASVIRTMGAGQGRGADAARLCGLQPGADAEIAVPPPGCGGGLGQGMPEIRREAEKGTKKRGNPPLSRSI